MSDVRAHIINIINQTNDLSKRFLAFEKFLKDVSEEQISESLEAIEDSISKTHIIILDEYNKIVAKDDTYIEKFKNYLNSFEKIKNQFFIQIDENSIKKKDLKNYFKAFSKLSEALKKQFL